jgi:hypothetical protein
MWSCCRPKLPSCHRCACHKEISPSQANSDSRNNNGSKSDSIDCNLWWHRSPGWTYCSTSVVEPIEVLNVDLMHADIVYLAGLSAEGAYNIRVPTRDPASASARAIENLPRVTVMESRYDSEKGLRSCFANQDACYFLINSFDIREPDEYFWTMRAYEIAVQSGLKHFIYSGARHRLREHMFKEEYRNSHNTVKAHLSDWLRQQDCGILPWSIVYGGVYAEMLSGMLRPVQRGDEYIFAAPTNETGLIPLMPLENHGITVSWVLRNPQESVGQFITAGACPSSLPEIVSTFTSVTGKKARFLQITHDQWFENASKSGVEPDKPLPRGASPDDQATFTFRKTFSAWWNMWRDNVAEVEDRPSLGSGVTKEIPGRITSLREWMEKTNYQGEFKEPIKMRRDGAALALSQKASQNI